MKKLIILLLAVLPTLVFGQDAQPAENMTGDTPQDVQPVDQPVGKITGSTPGFTPKLSYNLKVMIDQAPVYQESTLVSPIIARLQRGSVTSVIAEADNWYQVEFGPQDERVTGWVISYGVEKTHELEYIVRGRDDNIHLEGKRVVVISGEAAVRDYPYPEANLIMTVYRGEVFNLADEREDYFMIELSNEVRGWIWKADVENYVDPKYGPDDIRDLSRTYRSQSNRLIDLHSLMDDLVTREKKLQENIAKLQEMWQKEQERRAREALKAAQPKFWDTQRLIDRSRMAFGINSQGFNADLGLSSAMQFGIGYRFEITDKLWFDISNYAMMGTTNVIPPLDGQDPLPPSLDGIDTLSVKTSTLRMGIGCTVKPPPLPIISMFDHTLFAGISRVVLKPAEDNPGESQTMWGPVFSWGITKKLFGAIYLDFTLNWMYTKAEVTKVTSPGAPLLERESKYMLNKGFTIGGTWDF